MGCRVTYNGCDEELPHHAIVKGGGEEMGAFLSEEGSGDYDLIAYQTAVGESRHEYRYRFRFSDPDTAFWFRVKFG